MANRIRLQALVVGLLAFVTVGDLVTDGPRGAALPAFATIAAAFALYMNVRHPQPPARWTRRRIVLMTAIGVPVTAAVLGVLSWLLVSTTEPGIRLLAGLSLLLVVGFSVWFVRDAQREHRTAIRGDPT